MSRGTEFKVGLTVLLSIASGIVAVVWLKNLSLHDRKQVYVVAFPNTGGLAASDEVQVNGIRKGQVRDMRLQGMRVLVDLELANDVVLTRDCRVAIRNVGLMGEKVIAVDMRATGAAYSPRDTVIGVYEPGLGEVMGQVGATVDALSEMVSDLHDVAHTLNRSGRIEGALNDLSSTSHELRALVTANRAVLTETMNNFAAASKSARAMTAGNEGQVKQAIDHLASAAETMDRLSGRLDSLRVVVQSISGKVNTGDGTMSRLVNDARLYDELSGSVTALKGLIEDIRKNPRKYFKVSVF